VEVHIRPATGHQTIVDGLNDIRPQIVHFSGHANDQGIALDSGETEGDSSQFLSYALLREVLEGTSTPPALIVLNACNTSHAKSELLQVCDALISMQNAVGDADAVIFAARFYAAVAAKQPLDKCFRQGVTALKLAGSPDSSIPVLDTSPGAPASSIRLL
jgi:CHAT domain-containing protein